MAKRSENRGGRSGEKPTFETALSLLEKAVDRLESDDLTLEESLVCFEDGVRNIRLCEEHLKNAKGRLMELSLS